MSKVPFFLPKNGKTKYSAKVGLQFQHSTWVYIHAMSEQSLLSASTGISQTNFKQRGCYMKTINYLALN